jgi:hypothetical protein
MLVSGYAVHVCQIRFIFYKQSGNTDTGFDYTEPIGDVVIECQESIILKLLVK